MADRFHVPGQLDTSVIAAWTATMGGSGGSSVPTTGDSAYYYYLANVITAAPPDDLALCVVVGTGGGFSNVTFDVSNGSSAEMQLSGRFSALEFGADASNGVDLLRVFQITGSKLVLQSGTFAMLDLGDSDVECEIEANCTVTAIRGGKMPITIRGGGTGTAVTDLVSSGRVTTERTINKLRCSGNVRAVGTADLGTSTSTNTVEIEEGGNLSWESTGTLYNVTARARSVISARKAPASIAVAGTAPAVYRGASYFADRESAITHANDPEYIGWLGP